MIRRVLTHRLILILILATLLLTACGERARTPRVTSDWGRAGRVGVSSRSTPVGLLVSPDGERVVLAWPTRQDVDAQDQIHLLALDKGGAVVADQTLELSIDDLKQVQLLMGDGGELHLLWSAGASASRTLWHAQLPALDSLSAAPLSPKAALISPPDVAIQWYKAALLSSGRLFILWLDADGQLSAQFIGQEPSTILLSDVVGADFQLDEVGNVHLAWSVQESWSRLALHHALLDPDTLTLAAPQLATVVAMPRDVSVDAVDGPVIGLEAGDAYVLWTQAFPGLQGVVEQMYIVDAGGQTEPQLLRIPFGFPPSTTEASGYFAYRHLSGVPSGGSGIQVNHAPKTVSAPGDETVWAFSALYATRTRQEYQPTLLYLRDGEILGYQTPTWTDHPSVNPVVAADADHNLYLAWADATGESYRYPIYLASTAPEMQAAWERLTKDDYLAVIGDLGNRITSGIFMIPLTVVWLLLPLPWLFLMLTRGYMYGNRSRWVLLVALWLYWASKYALTFEVLTYLPGLVYLPQTLNAIAIYLAPALTLVISTGLVWIVLHRKEFSVMTAYIPIALVDWILSNVMYAIGYFE